MHIRGCLVPLRCFPSLRPRICCPRATRVAWRAHVLKSRPLRCLSPFLFSCFCEKSFTSSIRLAPSSLTRQVPSRRARCLVCCPVWPRRPFRAARPPLSASCSGTWCFPRRKLLSTRRRLHSSCRRAVWWCWRLGFGRQPGGAARRKHARIQTLKTRRRTLH